MTNTISKEELIQLRDLANKMLATLEPEPEIIIKKKRGRPKKVKQEQQEQEQVQITIPKYIPKPNPEVDETEFAKPQKMSARQRGEARSEPISLTKNRPNEFEKMMGRVDIKREVDKELEQAKFINDNVQTIPRGERPIGLVEITCSRCHRDFQVSPGTIYSDSGIWRCNNCARYPG